MTESEQERLQYALNELNQRIEELLTKYGDGISIRPYANYSDADGYCRVLVEVTTGRVVLKST
jgi:hypothetical protein